MTTWIDVAEIGIPVLVAVGGWIFNEWSKRKWEAYKRKEERYIRLLEHSVGFYESADTDLAAADKNKFIHELRAAWLYCPDDIIHAGNRFLAAVGTNQNTSQDQKRNALSTLAMEMRKDLFSSGIPPRSETALSPSDYQHLKSS